MLLPLLANAANNPVKKIWTVPELPYADAEVTIYFDVTGTALENINEDIYLWSWYPLEPDKGNWSNSSSFAKLTKDDGNVWKITITPTKYYNVAVSQVDAIYGLLKNKTGTKQTEEFAPDKTVKAITVNPTSAPPAKTPVLSFFPQKITQRDILTISRTDNGASVTGLTYTISVGSDVVDQGNFQGTSSSFSVSINLVEKLGKFSALDKIHINIADNNGNVISDTDFGLVVIK